MFVETDRETGDFCLTSLGGDSSLGSVSTSTDSKTSGDGQIATLLIWGFEDGPETLDAVLEDTGNVEAFCNESCVFLMRKSSCLTIFWNSRKE